MKRCSKNTVDFVMIGTPEHSLGFLTPGDLIQHLPRPGGTRAGRIDVLGLKTPGCGEASLQDARNINPYDLCQISRAFADNLTFPLSLHKVYS